MTAATERGEFGTAMSAGSGPLLGETEFQFLRGFVRQHCGISLGDHKRPLVQGRLLRRLRALGLRQFSAYCELLQRDPEGELDELTSAISTNVTAFFRESHHYDLIEAELLPQWIKDKSRSGDRLRIWSAGCSTGEEPYALAMVLAEALEREKSPLNARILATDLSPRAVHAARRGIYSLDRITAITQVRRRRWMLRGTGEYEGFASVQPRLRELVTIEPLNLLDIWPMQGGFDAIFCRNVMIYFDQPTRQRLINRYAAALASGGFLFLGHSESLYGISDAFELVGRTVYRKRQ